MIFIHCCVCIRYSVLFNLSHDIIRCSSIHSMFYSMFIRYSWYSPFIHSMMVFHSCWYSVLMMLFILMVFGIRWYCYRHSLFIILLFDIRDVIRYIFVDVIPLFDTIHSMMIFVIHSHSFGIHCCHSRVPDISFVVDDVVLLSDYILLLSDIHCGISVLFNVLLYSYLLFIYSILFYIPLLFVCIV